MTARQLEPDLRGLMRGGHSLLMEGARTQIDKLVGEIRRAFFRFECGRSGRLEPRIPRADPREQGRCMRRKRGRRSPMPHRRGTAHEMPECELRGQERGRRGHDDQAEARDCLESAAHGPKLAQARLP
jgi:hypothetical protein